MIASELSNVWLMRSDTWFRHKALAETDLFGFLYGGHSSLSVDLPPLATGDLVLSSGIIRES